MGKNKLRETRLDRGLSQLQLCFLSGVPNTVISDIELGKRLPWPKARRDLARALEATEGDLFPVTEETYSE